MTRMENLALQDDDALCLDDRSVIAGITHSELALNRMENLALQDADDAVCPDDRSVVEGITHSELALDRMENLSLQDDHDVVRRDDGTVVAGITRSELAKYSELHHTVPKEELIDIIDTRVGLPFDKGIFEYFVEFLDGEREMEKERGIPASSATSLFMLLSVHVKPMKSSSLSVYGEISTSSASGGYLYKRELKDVETFQSDGGYLTLNGPSGVCMPASYACSILQSRKLSIRLYDQQKQQLYPLVDNDDADPIILAYSPDYFEHVQDKVVENTEISLTLKYVSIPMAVFGRLDFRICNRQRSTKNSSKFVDVYGKVVATYRNTFGGNYKSQEFLLFDKNPDSKQYQRLHIDRGGADLLSSSRCWLAAPAFSLLNLRFDLFDSEKKPILTQDIELDTLNSCRASKHLVSGEYLLAVSALWYTPKQPPPQDGCQPCALPRRPSWDSAIEVFSVLVCPREESTSPKIHGRLQVIPNFKEVDIFKKEEGNSFTLLGRGDTITVIDGSRQIDGFCPLSMICDLKDAISGMSIKGYESLNNNLYYERQLCSIFRGDLGFVALHYSFFSSAVQANLKVSVHPPKGSQCAVFGSICARYKYFDYSSQYKKNCCRIVLFKRSRDDSVQMDTDGLIPLSRTLFIVPSYSSPIFDLDFMIGTQKFSDEINVPISTGTSTEWIIRRKECEVKFVLQWGDVK